MTCGELVQTLLHQPIAAAERSEFAWTEQKRRRRVSPRQQHQQQSKQQQDLRQQRVISGLLPTLRTLSTLSSDSDISKQGICLVSLEGNLDAANHLQTTLLEAYCREIGLRLLKLPELTLRRAFGREHRDLDCLLVLDNDRTNFFLESPE